MTDTSTGHGRCLCGNVEVTANTMNREFDACHCRMCRKWTGGPLLAVDCGTDVTFSGKEHIGVYDSSEWAERGFCKNCGTHLFYRLKGNNQYIIPLGLFENADDLVFANQIFIDQKPVYYAFSNDTHNMTGAEVFAKYAPDGGE